MTILRDITVKLGLQLDKTGFNQAETALGGLKSKFSGLRGALVGAGALFGLQQLTKLASDASETLNVMSSVFGQSSQDVQDWADTFGDAAGRSSFMLRDMAGTLGAVLNPMLDRNTELTAALSSQLAELAVDLGSFFNTTDEAARIALRAGITGEPEPLKRFGIVMQNVTLEAFRLKEGLKKTFKEMTIAEKTQLRIAFIMDQTNAAQGDAIKTADGWANATKGLAGALRDLATRLGAILLPGAERIVGVARDAVLAFNGWVKGTEFLTGVMVVLGTVAALTAATVLAGFSPVIAMGVLVAVPFIAAALAIDEFLVFMKKGDSVIGRLIDRLFGPGSAGEAVDLLRESWDLLVDVWDLRVLPAIKDVGGAFKDMGKDVLGVLKTVELLVRGGKGALVDRIVDEISTIGPTGDTQTQGGIARRMARGARQALLPQIPGPFGSTIPLLPNIGQEGISNSSNMTTNNSVTVNVPAGTSTRDARRIAQEGEAGMARVARKSRRALVQMAGGT